MYECILQTQRSFSGNSESRPCTVMRIACRGSAADSTTTAMLSEPSWRYGTKRKRLRFVLLNFLNKIRRDTHNRDPIARLVLVVVETEALAHGVRPGHNALAASRVTIAASRCAVPSMSLKSRPAGAGRWIVLEISGRLRHVGYPRHCAGFAIGACSSSIRFRFSPNPGPIRGNGCVRLRAARAGAAGVDRETLARIAVLSAVRRLQRRHRQVRDWHKRIDRAGC